MKETQQTFARDKEIELRRHKKTKLMGTIRRIRGLTLFEYNHKTRHLKKINLQARDQKFDIKANQAIHEVKVSEDCYYLQALNLRNALKKLMKQGYPVESYDRKSD